MDDAAKRQRITQNAAEIKKLKALVAAMRAKGLGGSKAGKPTRDWGFYCAIATCCVVPPITAMLATRGKGQVVSRHQIFDQPTFISLLRQVTKIYPFLVLVYFFGVWRTCQSAIMK